MRPLPAARFRPNLLWVLVVLIGFLAASCSMESGRSELGSWRSVGLVVTPAIWSTVILGLGLLSYGVWRRMKKH